MIYPKPIRYLLHIFGVRFWRQLEIDEAKRKGKEMFDYFSSKRKAKE